MADYASNTLEGIGSGDASRPLTSGPSNVLVVCPRVVATFTRQDVEILKAEFSASLFPFGGLSDLYRLRQALDRASAVVIWFAGRHAAPTVWLARRRGIPVLTIVGGYEVFWYPEIKYGVPPRSLRARYVGWVLRHSDRIAVVSKFMENRLSVLHPDAIRKTVLIPNAVATERFQPGTEQIRQEVLSVGHLNANTLAVKGWTLFRDVARTMPKIRFAAVGPVDDRVGREFVAGFPPNVKWLGALYGPELVRQYQNASVYFQGSVHESFSLALAESMACGCIPVVSRNGALPEVAGDTGFYLDDLTPESAIMAITAALNAPEQRRLDARDRIVQNFSLKRRRQALCDLVHQMIESS